jgi:hypothetical protein
MTSQPRGLSASVAARLLNRAKQTGDVYQTLLTSFCFERFLYRLGISDVRERLLSLRMPQAMITTRQRGSP